MELWKDIPCYEGIYQASNTGRIRTCEGKTTTNARFPLRHWEQRILKQKYSKNKFGRSDARVNLWKDGIEKTWLVARLVGLTWCDGYEDGKTINHINGNSLDNRADNLEWTSLAENIRKGFEDGLYPQKRVRLYNADAQYEFISMSKAGQFLGRSKGYISDRVKKSMTATDRDGTLFRIEVLI